MRIERSDVIMIFNFGVEVLALTTRCPLAILCAHDGAGGLV
jgi:hypothetical protein